MVVAHGRDRVVEPNLERVFRSRRVIQSLFLSHGQDDLIVFALCIGNLARWIAVGRVGNLQDLCAVLERWLEIVAQKVRIDAAAIDWTRIVRKPRP